MNATLGFDHRAKQKDEIIEASAINAHVASGARLVLVARVQFPRSAAMPALQPKRLGPLLTTVN